MIAAPHKSALIDLLEGSEVGKQLLAEKRDELLRQRKAAADALAKLHPNHADFRGYEQLLQRTADPSVMALHDELVDEYHGPHRDGDSQASARQRARLQAIHTLRELWKEALDTDALAVRLQEIRASIENPKPLPASATRPRLPRAELLLEKTKWEYQLAKYDQHFNTGTGGAVACSMPPRKWIVAELARINAELETAK